MFNGLVGMLDLLDLFNNLVTGRYKDDLVVGVDELRSGAIRRSRVRYPLQKTPTILITNVIDRFKKKKTLVTLVFSFPCLLPTENHNTKLGMYLIRI
jgi:hypothetical protein